MSADLIITKLNPEINGILSWENVLKGYFIDVYNHTGVFAVLSTNLNKEYSWVATYHRKELFPIQSEKPLIHIPGIKKFLQEMKKAKNQFFSLKDPVIEDWRTDVKQKMTDDEFETYKEYLNMLILFLDIARRINSKIYFDI